MEKFNYPYRATHDFIIIAMEWRLVIIQVYNRRLEIKRKQFRINIALGVRMQRDLAGALCAMQHN